VVVKKQGEIKDQDTGNEVGVRYSKKCYRKSRLGGIFYQDKKEKVKINKDIVRLTGAGSNV
jgi:hypothetical protein